MSWTASELVDLDNDGYLDLVLGGSGSNSASLVLWNRGNGSFNPVPTRLPAEKDFVIIVDIAPIELNGDGDIDLVLSTTRESPFYSGRYFQVVINNGDHDFADGTAVHIPEQNTLGDWVFRLEVIDLNLDGAFDLIALCDSANPDRSESIWLNDGNGVLSLYKLRDKSMNGTMIPLDFDNDGDKDFLVLAVLYSGTEHQVQQWTSAINNTR
jgi:hypothetical protein